MKSLTKGNPLKLILLFAIPLFAGRLLQMLYSIVDTRIVGVTLGETALAAVGGTSTLSDLLIDFMTGVTNGFAIIVATCFGAKDERNMQRAVKTTFLLTFSFTFMLTVVSVVFLQPILSILHVPEEILTEAGDYIRIILLGLICMAMYNACAGILRAVGDSVSSLLFLLISTIMNIGLDYAFICGLSMGVAGAAFATIISQGVSFILCLFYMWKKYPDLFLSMEYRSGKASKDVPEYVKNMGRDRISVDLLRRMLQSGMSMGFMSAFVSFGTVSLQTAINTFGKDIIVAHAAARKMTGIFMLPFSGFGQTLATYCGQNMGAGEYKRIKKGIVQTLLVTWGWCLCVILSAQLFSGQFITWITGSRTAAVVENGGLYLRFDTAFYFVPAMITLFRNSLQGVGDARTPVISSFIEFAGKLVIALFLAPRIGYMGIIVAEPIVWCLMVIPLIVQFFKNPMINRSI